MNGPVEPEADSSRTGVVEAAGGLVVRRAADGCVEVVVVHRPAYDDWTLPKGKRKRSETARDCALREVEEETGLRCNTRSELPRTSYVLPDGRTKTVRWWLMDVAEDPGFSVNNEVDEIRWVRAGAVEEVLTYGMDVTVVLSAGEFTRC